MTEEFRPDCFAAAIISIITNCMPYEGFTVTDARIVEEDDEYPYPYVLIHAWLASHERYIDSMVPLRIGFSDLEAVGAVAHFMDAEPVWRVSVRQEKESPLSYNDAADRLLS